MLPSLATDARSEAVVEWAAAVGLCFRLHQHVRATAGGSIVNLSFASSAVAAKSGTKLELHLSTINEYCN